VNFEYSLVFPPRADGSYIKRPILSVAFFANGRKASGVALVDSGADMSLAHRTYAEKLALSSFQKTVIRGIGAVDMPCAVANVEISIEGSHRTIMIPFGFVDSPLVDVILGRGTFFDTHDVLFKADRGTFEIARITKKRQ